MRRAPAQYRLAAVTALASLGACRTDALRVQDIDVAAPQTVQDSSALPSLLAGAIGNFGFAYDGGGDLNQISLSALLGDEFIDSDSFGTRIEVDRRSQQFETNTSLNGAFYTIQQARAAAEFAADAFRKFSPTDVGLAESLNLGALTYVILAENYCGAVPISHEVSPGEFSYGVPLSTRRLLERAIEKADSAAAIVDTGTAANALVQARVARVAKARALLDLDQATAAAAAINGVAGVPTTFKYEYSHSEATARQNNYTWFMVQGSGGRYSIPNLEGLNGLPFRAEGDTSLTTGTVRDPRVANIRRAGRGGLGFDNATPAWWQLKYPADSSKVVIADGVEARLIEAEALLRGGNSSGALATLNALRSDAALRTLRGYTRALAALPAETTPAAQVNQLFKERAYWLFLTSHRLGDLRRLTRPTSAQGNDITGYGRAIETVYPTGDYHKGGTYGTDVNSPIPRAEGYNPSFNRAACDVAKP